MYATRDSTTLVAGSAEGIPLPAGHRTVMNLWIHYRDRLQREVLGPRDRSEERGEGGAVTG